MLERIKRLISWEIMSTLLYCIVNQKTNDAQPDEAVK